MATASVQEDILGQYILYLLHIKRQQKSSYRQAVIDYFIKYSPYASWTWLASRLYWREEHEALSAVKKFIKRTRGKCVHVYSDVSVPDLM